MTFKGLFATPAGHGRRAVSFFCALAAVVALASPACNSSSGGNASSQNQTCALNSDCAMNLICAFGKCTVECQTDADCGNGGMCVITAATATSKAQAACQTPAEANAPCNTEADCPVPLACASDFRCRNLCMSNVDCNVLGITGKVCAADENGVHYCADPADVSDGGVINEAPPSGATGTVTEPDGSAPSGSGASSSGASSGGSGGSGSSSGSGGSSSGGSSGASSGSSGSSGGTGGCTPACGAGTECTGGHCVACGTTAGQACCGGTGGTCGSDLTCTNGTCACGGPGESCCGGTGGTCNTGVTCTNGTCACGTAGNACCPASSGTLCTGSLQCAGVDCTCQLACSGSVVQRSDGTLWSYYSTLTPVQDSNSNDVVATSFSAYYDTYIYSSTDVEGLGCYVDSGGHVWCWGANSYGQLGNGSSTSTSSAVPVEVVTDVVGPVYLSNITSVYVDGTDGDIACAIDTNTNVWCWGYGSYGALGNGATNQNENVATQVWTNSSQETQFSGAVSLAVADDHICALVPGPDADAGSGDELWCWGYNGYGQIGTGSTSTNYYYYPTQVSNLFSTVTQVAVGDNLTCAVTTDTSVWCWGNDSDGVVGNGQASGTVYKPFQVLAEAADEGGANVPFSGALSVQILSYYYVCARKSDSSIWCWGDDSDNGYLPTRYVQDGVAVKNSFVLCANSSGESEPGFIDSDGNMNLGGSVQTTQVTCP
jgi:hypothetical protein